MPKRTHFRYCLLFLHFGHLLNAQVFSRVKKLTEEDSGTFSADSVLFV